MSAEIPPIEPAYAGLLRRTWKRLIRPGARMMGDLRLRGKLTLLLVAVLVPVGALMFMTLHELQSDVDRAQRAREGASVARQSVNLVTATQRLYGLQSRLATNDTVARAELADARAALARDVVEFDAMLASASVLALRDAWAPVQRSLQALAAPAGPGVATAGDHAAAVAAVRQLLVRAAVDSGLMFGTDPATQVLANIAVHSIVPMIEAAGHARADGYALLRDGQATLAERTEMLAHARQLMVATQVLGQQLATYERTGGQAAGSWPGTRDALMSFGRVTEQRFTAEWLLSDPTAYLDLGTAAIQQTAALARDTNTRLDKLLLARSDSLRLRMTALASLYLVGLLVLGYLLWSFFVTFQHSLRQVLESTRAVSHGDLSRAVNVRGRDELSDIGESVDGMNERLSGLVAEIRSSAARVDVAGRQVAEGSQRLSQRTEQQAHEVRQSVDALAGLTQAASHNAQAARELDGVTERLFAQVEAGHASMADTVAAMQLLQETSQRVTDVVAVIDDVAFETGMLAINAAIEASRAGEAGKGFAIVAGEVRQLALRCAASADEIRQLIGTAGEQVKTSSQKLDLVSGSLDTIVDGVRVVSTQLRTIAEDSSRQSDSLQQVAGSVATLDSMTSENAALVEDSTAAANTLVERAAALRASVASMRLRHGSADEARALVERAVQHIDTVGRTQALADFNSRATDWVDRDLYVFCIDRLGTFSALGGDPTKAGSSVSELPGISGTDFLDRAWAAADNGGDWVRYDMVSPLNGRVTPKESWVCKAAEDMLVGCGAYLNTMTIERVPVARSESWSRRAASARRGAAHA